MADLNEMLVAWTGEIDSFMYTYILVILLVFVGIYYTIRTKAVQIRYIKDMFTQLTEKKHVQGEKSISSFQALMVSTASRVGTGNIAGIATAIATGPNATQWNLCSTRREPAAFSWDRQKRACAGPLSGSVNSTGPNTSPDTTILLTVSKPRLLPSQAIRLGG